MTSRWRRRLRRALVCALAGSALASIAWSMVRADAGAPVAALDDDWHLGHRVVDRNGALLRELPTERGRRGQEIELEAVGERLMAATLVAEDRSFRAHDGISRRDILRAGTQNLSHGRLISGASTVTQQLVKMLDHQGESHRRTLGLKIDEAMRAQNLEAELDKDAILEAYFNRLPYGHGLVGPKAAARGYFGVAPAQLSWAQAAFLAVLPRAPSYLDPRAHPERAALRQRALLQDLHALGHLDAAALQRALAEPLELAALERPFHAPHLIESLRLAGELDGAGETRTTLDLELQRDVEGLASTHISTLQAREVSDAAVLVVDNRSGDILAYVGSADFHDPAISGQVDMIRARRQPGSTLKPFVYAFAFEEGHYASEMLADVPTRFGETGGEYRPHNFSNEFLGPVSARHALAGSLNVPAVRLAAELPEGQLLARLHDLGFDSLDRDPKHYGLALALGSGEVELRELAAAYVALARGGERIPLRAILSDDPAIGEGERVLAPDVAASIAQVLADPLARVRLTPGRSPFGLGFDVAVKTGTSSGYRDAWAVGFTHEFTVAVWVGNASGAAMDEVTGAGGAGPLFADVMRRVMRDVRVRQPVWDREQLVNVEVCGLTGKRLASACPHAEHRWLAKDHLPDQTCDAHVRVERRRASPGQIPLACSETGEQVAVLLPPSFDAWLSTWELGAPGKDPAGLPWFSRDRVEGCATLDPASARLQLTAPAAGSVFLLGTQRGEQSIEVAADSSGVDAKTRALVEEVEFVLDGEVVARSRFPYRAWLPASAGDHELRVRAAADLPLRGDVIHFSVR